MSQNNNTLCFDFHFFKPREVKLQELAEEVDGQQLVMLPKEKTAKKTVHRRYFDS